MKKLMIILLILISLVSCNNNTTTFDEEIIDGKVIIDEIEYTINEIIKETYKYDKKGNIISMERFSGNKSDYIMESIYENELLMRTNLYMNNTLTSYWLYSYENDKLVRSEYHAGEIIQCTDIAYSGDVKETRTTDSNFGLVNVFIDKFDASGKIITREHHNVGSSNYIGEEKKEVKSETVNIKSSEVNDQEEGTLSLKLDEITMMGPSLREFFYNGNLLNRTQTTQDDKIVSKANYEYNDIGDEIVSYRLDYGGGIVTLLVSLYEYDYNSNNQIKKKTEYRIYSEIDENNIRRFD